MFHFDNQHFEWASLSIVMVEFEHSSTVFRSIMEVTNMVISYYFGSTEGVSWIESIHIIIALNEDNHENSLILSAVFIVETYHEEPRLD